MFDGDLIDGVYLNHGLSAADPDWAQAVAAVVQSLEDATGRKLA